MHKLRFPTCRGCGASINTDNLKSKRDYQHRRSGFCSLKCKRTYKFCSSLCCLEKAEGAFCKAHQYAEVVKRTKHSYGAAKRWCVSHGIDINALPEILPFRGWPDNSISCEEVKIGFDVISWQQILRFAWIEQRFNRRVKIAWAHNHIEAVEGKGIVFDSWQDHLQWMTHQFKSRIPHTTRSNNKLYTYLAKAA